MITVLQPTPSRFKRTEATDSSSASSSDRCKHNSSSPECQKPVSTNVITIVVAIVIPVVVIVIILGALWYMNWRKFKKESLDHDPDFDETGEATALPDFLPPRFHPGPIQPDDPFSNNASAARSFPKPQYRPTTMPASDATSIVADPYLEDLVLPYLHQTSSKASLTEYARHLVDTNSYGPSYSHSPSNIGSRPALYAVPRPDSPQRSNLSRPMMTGLPPTMRTVHGGYNPLLNTLHLSVERPRQDASSFLVGSQNAGIQYENESLSHIGKLDSATLSFGNAELDSQEKAYMHTTGHGRNHQSPFDSHDAVYATHAETHDPNFSGRPTNAVHQQNDNANDDRRLLYESLENAVNSQRGILDPVHCSDDTTAVDVSVGDLEDPDELTEDIQRLKSVYRVYFDKKDAVESETKKTDQNEHAHDENSPPNVDPGRAYSVASSVYPEIPKVTGEVPYVPQTGGYGTDQGYNFHSGQTYDPQTEQYQPNGSNFDYLNYQPDPRHFQNYMHPDQSQYLYQNSGSGYPMREPVNQAPLKLLKNASDHRMSSIETFTDFAPKHTKVNLPRSNIHAGDGHWDGSYESPPIGVTLSAAGSTLNLGHVPSASQLARQLVVMVDPVAGIPYQKGFKPAGSLTPNATQMMLPQLPVPYTVGESISLQSDLIPGNRKSDVRRMMNTNF